MQFDINSICIFEGWFCTVLVYIREDKSLLSWYIYSRKWWKMLISTFFFLNAFSVENLAKRKKAIVIVVYLMHIKWLYFVRKHHIIKNRINILLSTSISYSAHRAINTNPEFYEILRNICYDSFPTTIHKTEKKTYIWSLMPAIS